MAPATKKAKTAATSPPAGNGSLSKMFGFPASSPKKTTDAPATEAAAPATAAPATNPMKQLFAPKAVAQSPETKTTPARQDPQPEAEAQATPQATPQAAAPGPAGLSDEQRKRIEENRRLALERKEAKKRALEEGSAGAATPSRPETPAAAPAPTPAPVAAPQAAPPAEATAKPGFPWPKAKAQPKGAAAGKAKAKAKGKADSGNKSGLFGSAAAASPQSSPTKNPATNPNLAASTPEKTALPAQEKRTPSTETAAAPLVALRAPSAPSSRFETVKCPEWNQYVSLYAARLKQLRGRVQEEARSLWGGMVAAEGFCSDISGFRGAGCDEVVLCGVLFKELKGRPNVIEECQKYKLAKPAVDLEAEIAALSPGAYCTEEDVLYMEDTSMRLQLEVSKEQLAQLATGLVAGVRGVPTPDGSLKVMGFIFARLPPPPTLPAPADDASAAPFLVLVSGIAPGDAVATEGEAKSPLAEARGRLFDFLAKGLSGAKLQRMIVCGGALCSKRVLGRGEKLSKGALAGADDLLSQLAGAVPTDLMPGRTDPTNLSLPQMPLHPHLFKKARACPESSFRCVSNPHTGSIEGCTVLGHSGQPVDDFMRCTKGTTPLGVLQMCLESMHLAPTAPDTLPMPPLSNGEDPFVMQEVPNVLFTAGHQRADNFWLPAPRGDGPTSGTQLICVPAWEAQPAAVLVNLRDPRDVRVQKFGEPAAEVAAAA